MGTYLRFLFASIIMLIIAATTGDIYSITNITLKQKFIFLIIAFTTGGTVIFLYYGLKRISASVASICELAFPLTAVVLLISILKVSGIKIFNSNNMRA